MAVSTRARITRRLAPRRAPPARKPMAAARRLTVFQRRVELGLSPTALEVVFDAMEVVSEGHLDGSRYCGSTMISIDLTRLVARLSDHADAATARRFAELAPADPRVRARVRALAFAEGIRIAGGTLIQPEIDLEVRAQGPVVHFALDLEAILDLDRSRPPVVRLSCSGG